MVRLKHRFIICQLIDDSSLPVSSCEAYTAGDIATALKEKVVILLGDYSSIHSISIKYYDHNTRLFVVRVDRDGEVMIRTAMSLVTAIKKNNVMIRTLSVHGSSRTAVDQLKKTIEVLVSLTIHDNDELQLKYDYYSTVLQGIEL